MLRWGATPLFFPALTEPHITVAPFRPHMLNMENALLDLLDVLIVFAIGFGVIMIALPPTYGGVWPRKQSGPS